MGAAPALYKKLPYDPVKDFAPVFRFQSPEARSSPEDVRVSAE